MIEMICVLIILGLLAVWGVPKIINIDQNAELKALEVGVESLNKIEKFAWSEYKLSADRYPDAEVDILISSKVDKNIGERYKWNGMTLSFGTAKATLERIPATNASPGMWGGVDSKGNKYGWYKNPNNPHNQ
jgi:type II secretory pathway pseudopilin PulG